MERDMANKLERFYASDKTRKIGIIGGMSAQSTVHYYEQLVNRTQELLGGGLHSPEIMIRSVNFGPIEELQREGEWKMLGEILADKAVSLEEMGADFILIATNTMHKVEPRISRALCHAKVLHIADATAEALRQDGIKKVALLGTSYTMEQDFYKGRLEKAGFQVLVPETQEERDEVNRIIFKELCKGKEYVSPKSKPFYDMVIKRLKARGAEGVILGCTEICDIVDKGPGVYDTTAIHVEAAAQCAVVPDNMTLNRMISTRSFSR